MRSGWIMLIISTSLYGTLYVLRPELFVPALKGSQAILIQIAPVLLLVVLIMTVMNMFIEPKKIAKHLGEKSGVKGWFIAIIGGIISHGPGYIWYPLIEDMRKHGAKDGLVVTFFYARAIKIPWLPVMVAYFGLTYTIVISLYVILAALAQGLLTQHFFSTERTKES